MKSSSHVKPIEILLVEDNIGDADLTREALDSSKVRNRLHVVADGEDRHVVREEIVQRLIVYHGTFVGYDEFVWAIEHVAPNET